MPIFADLTKILKKPGEGLLTVTTGSGEAAKLLGAATGKVTEQQWRKQAKRKISEAGPQLIALPNDSGGGICRGAAHGPLHLRAALYAERPSWAATDLGDLPCIPQLLDDAMLNPAQLEASGRALWGPSWKASMPVSPLNLLKDFLVQGFRANPEGFRPLILGGDHSASWAVSEALFETGLWNRSAVLHFDAHTDLLKVRYGIARCFGTWAAHAVERMPPRNRGNFVQVGVRVSGRSRAHWEKTFGLRQLWARDVLGKHPAEFAAGLVGRWKEAGCERLYVSFDVDALDPRFVPSTGTAERGGLEPEWCRKVIEACSEGLPLVTADIVELAPVLGSKSEGRRSARVSARVAHTLLEGLQRSLLK